MAAPTFSYAQAARGLNSSIPTPTPASTETGNNQTAPKSKDVSQGKTVNGNTIPQTKNHVVDSAIPEKQNNHAPPDGGVVEGQPLDKEKDTGDVSSKRRSLSGAERQKVHVQSSSVSPAIDAGTVSAPVSDVGFQLPNGKMSQSDAFVEDSKDLADPAPAQDADKAPREAEDDWEKISAPSTSAEKSEKELRAAPIPTVNFWTQRLQAQEAKTKEVATQRTSSTSTRTSAAGTEAQGKDRASTDRRNAPQKQTPNSPSQIDKKQQQPPSRASRPSVGQVDKDVNVMPPVVDAGSWPTPDIAPSEDRRKSGSLEQSEKPETDVHAHAQKSRGNKWVHVPFVPTAKFETPLPASISRRGGARTGNRGRDTNGRGGHAPAHDASSEKVDANLGVMGPPPLPKHATEQDRGRRSDGRSGRAASLPTSGRRTESEEKNLASGSKFAAAARHEQAKNDESKVSSSTNMATPSSEMNGELVGASRSSSRNKDLFPQATNGVDTSTQETSPPNHKEEASVDPEALGRQDSFPERHRFSATSSPRGNGEVGRERHFAPRNGHWSKDRPDAFRAKVESWRDREDHSDYVPRREARGERGRGGHRGRGNPSNYGTHHLNLQSFTAPLPQGAFDPAPRSSSLQDSRSRQSSQPFVMPQGSPYARPNPRSQSIPMGMMYPGYMQDIPGMHQTMSPIQAEVQGLGLGLMPQTSAQPGMLPFGEHLNSYAVMSMVAQQVEYYFSIDNLCKDMYLRQNMDSQGYVSLGVIAKFRRMQSLLGDQDAIGMLRYVCQSLRTVEYRPGENGDDVVRRREDWKSFVLPMDERKPEARNDGPTHDAHQQFGDSNTITHANKLESVAEARAERSPSSFGGFAPTSPKPQMGFQGLSAFEARLTDYPAANQADFQRTTSRTSTASPLSPKQNVTHSPMPSIIGYGPTPLLTNGHRQSIDAMTTQQGLFPDEKISEIMITCTQGEVGELWNASEESGEHENNSSSMPNLRGGAGSPQQLSQGLQHLPYLQVLRTALKQRERGDTGLALTIIYRFWAEFLVDNFNASIYQDFHETAIDDFEHSRQMGGEFLGYFYEKILTTPRLEMTDQIAHDVVQLARLEKGDTRPMFQKLRLAWRNGATNLKTRKRLADHLTKEEKEVFDK